MTVSGLTGSPTSCYVRKPLSSSGSLCGPISNFACIGVLLLGRINVRDPNKRLGISREVSEDEIQAARNFLIRQYEGHKPSVDAIESAHDKIIMQKFYERKNPKINIKKKFREVSQSHIVQAVRSRFQTPSTQFIIKTSIAFIVLGALTVLFPTEEGPTLQRWIIRLLIALGNLLDGVCNSTYT